MPARTGEQFLRGLKDDREVWLGGEKVTDPASHPALSGGAHAIAEVFDLQHAQADVCLMPDPETGEPINVSHMIPRSRADLERRHAGLEAIAEYSVGLMGRTPDYMNVTYAGFAGRPDEWSISGNEAGAANLVALPEAPARADLSLTHTIVQPTVDQAHKAMCRWPAITVALHKVARPRTASWCAARACWRRWRRSPTRSRSIRPPRCRTPSDAHALRFCIPMATPGLKFLCRDSFSRARHHFDHPFSSRFDEQDAFVIFDDVEVPRDRVFIDGNLAAYNG